MPPQMSREHIRFLKKELTGDIIVGSPLWIAFLMLLVGRFFNPDSFHSIKFGF
jgi:hypothetical protein